MVHNYFDTIFMLHGTINMDNSLLPLKETTIKNMENYFTISIYTS